MDDLEHPSDRYEFFQLVRLIERRRARRRSRERGDGRAVGHDGPPEQEVLRFGSTNSHRFPATEVGEARTEEASPRIGVPTTVIGLTGPNGVLPQHYTTLLLQRLRQRDRALRDFLDLFHHRVVSLFYRAWLKLRVPVDYERAAVRGELHGDDFTTAVLSLVGLGTDGQRERLPADESFFLENAGHFAHRLRPAHVLRGMLTEHFGVPVEVREFQPQWLRIGPDARSRLPTRAHDSARYATLGENVVLGDRVLDVQGKFRLRVGPLAYDRFLRFLPNGRRRDELAGIARSYAGLEFDVDVQLVLRSNEVPPCRLSGTGTDEATGVRLGWNTWLQSRPATGDVDDAIFALD